MRNNDTFERWKYLGIIYSDKNCYYINKKCIKFNRPVNFFNLLYKYIIYNARTWAEEK